MFPQEVMPTVRRRILASSTDLLFHNRNGSYIEPSNFRRALREFREAYPAWADVTARSFRKTVATVLDGEYDSRRAAAQLGHPDERVTKRYYIETDHMAPESPILGSLVRKKSS